MRAAWPIGAALALLPAVSAASIPPPSHSDRVVGFGTAVGLGIEGTSRAPGTPFVAALGPSFEARIPVHRRVELALWIPMTNLLGLSLTGDRRMFWGDLFATVYPLPNARGLFVAPGIGMTWGTDGTNSGTSVRLPVRVGWEVSSAGRGFAFNVGLRPWFDVVFPTANIDPGVRYGAIFELGIVGYGLR